MLQSMWTKAGKAGSKAARKRPGLETLEDRCVPAAVTTTIISDRTGGLYSVDVATGKTTSMGKVGVALADLAMSPAGVLYGTASGKLYKITGLGKAPKATLAANLRDSFGRALAVTALEFRKDGKLFAAATDSLTSIYEVNVTTGASTLRITLPKQRGMTDNKAGDLVFDPNGNMYITIQNGYIWKWGKDGSLTSHWTALKKLNGVAWRDGALYAFADAGSVYRIAFGGAITKVSTLSAKTGVNGATQTF